MQVARAIKGYLLHRSTELSPETVKTERVWLRQFAEYLGDVEVSDVTSAHVRDFLLYQKQRNLSPFTLRRCHTSISAFYTWACSDDVALASDDPTDRVPPPKLPKRKPRALDTDDIEALLQAARQGRCPRRDRAIVLFLLDSGCRVSEVCNLTMEHLDLESGRILVEGKGSKERLTYLGRRARTATWLYISDERPQPAQVNEDRVFLTERGDTMSRFCLRDVIVRLANRVGVKATPHAFRHTAAILHLKNGMDLVSLQHLLGHSDISTTRHYLDALKDEDIQQRAQRTSPVDNLRL
jgi:site-specific recombinase XerD